MNPLHAESDYRLCSYGVSVLRAEITVQRLSISPAGDTALTPDLGSFWKHKSSPIAGLCDAVSRRKAFMNEEVNLVVHIKHDSTQ